MAAPWPGGSTGPPGLRNPVAWGGPSPLNPWSADIPDPGISAISVALADSAAGSDDSGFSWTGQDFPGLGEGAAASDAIVVTKLPATALPWVIVAAQDSGSANQIIVSQGDYASYGVAAGQQFQLYTGQPAAGANPATARVNANCSFETGVSPWTAQNGAAIAQSTLHPWGIDGGTHSCAMTPDGVTGAPQIASETITVIPGFLYVMAAECTASAAWSSGIKAYINWYGTSGFISRSSVAVSPIPAASLTVLQLAPAMPPAAATTLIIFAQAQGIPPATTVFYWDLVYASMYNALLSPQVYTITGSSTAGGYTTVTFTPPALAVPVFGTRMEQVT